MATAMVVRPGYARALGDAALAALIAAVLATPLVGLHAASQAAGLTLELRPAALATVVALVFLGRLGFVLVRSGHPIGAGAGGIALAAVGWLLPLPGEMSAPVAVTGGLTLALFAALRGWQNRPSHSFSARGAARLTALSGTVAHRLLPWIGAGLVIFAVLLPMLPFGDRRALDLATIVVIYVMLGWGLNIVVGLAGLLDLGYVAFYAVGAYSFALLALHFGMSFWECLPLAGALAAMFGILLGFPVLRLRGDYLAIVTLGFGEMIRIVLINWVPVTQGPNGISGIPRPAFFGMPFAASPPAGTTSFHQFFDLAFSPMHRVVFLYYVALLLALLTNLFILRIRRLPIGRAWEALREDEIACRALGIDPTRVKLSAFALGAMFGGFAGAVFAARQGFISPESFTFMESAVILAIVVLGGMGSQIGVAIAAILLIGIPEWFRELQDYRMLAFGAAMVLIMIWRPQGLLARREPSVRAPVGAAGRPA